MVNYKHLHYFCAVAREGGVARASERLNLTPQTTSGLLLMGMAVLALVLANGLQASVYEHAIHTLVRLDIGDWTMEMALYH